MVSVKYNTDNDGISLARAALEDDLIERNSSNRFWSIFSKRKKIQGAALVILLIIIIVVAVVVSRGKSKPVSIMTKERY